MVKTILVLGGFGFIGSNFLDYIDREKDSSYEVIVFSKREHPLRKKFKCVKNIYYGDFGNRTDLVKIFEENKIDEVFHFLNTTVPATSSDIRFDVESNLLATIRLLEIIENYKVKKFVYISSGGAIYNNTKLKNIESVDAFPTSSYGIVKLAIEKYIYMFSHKNNFSYLILRLSNPYGRFHVSESQGIINVALKRAFRGEAINIWGDGTNKKDYIFVDDFINILFALLKKGIENEIINIGSGQLYSINEIINKIRSLGLSAKTVYTDQKSFDNFNFQINNEKLRKYIGDYNFTSLNIGLEKTFYWVQQESTH